MSWPPQPSAGQMTLADVRAELLRVLQGQTAYGSYGPKSIPQQAVDVPLSTTFPGSPQDRDEVHILDSTNATLADWIWVKSLNRWIQVGAPPQYVTSLPSAPADGTEVFYVADAANGVVWHLRYDTNETTYKWRFLGGPPLYAEVATSQGTASTSYAALATAGPSITLPLAGDYMVRHGAEAFNNANTGYAVMSYDIGATGAVDADAVFMTSAAADNSIVGSVSRERRKTGLSAVALVAKYKAVFAGTATFANRWISVLPVRVN